MDKWRWFIFGGICVLIFGLVIFTREPSVPFNGDPAKVVEGDYVYGNNRKAKVVLVEYGDFQCPGCENLYLAMKTADFKNVYKDKIAFVFRHMPLTAIHPNAKAAAAAAEAAAQQGKFWEMHDTLYDYQSEWESASANTRASFFEKYAKSLGLNMTKFKEALGGKATSERILRDATAAAKGNVEKSTPALVLNGRLLKFEETSEKDATGESVFSIKKLEELVDKALKEAGEQPPIKTTETAAPAAPTAQSTE
ncbi:MAG TPA: thioredoxin domain-containing protein [Candidatus Saccharimonadales bacterium]